MFPGYDKKTSKKRHLLIDKNPHLNVDEMKEQMADTSPITRLALDMGPPTKALLNWKKVDGVHSIMEEPARKILSDKLCKV